MHDALWWEYKLISIAICFVIAVGCHVLYTILTNGRSLEDDARWYAQQRKEETARKKLNDRSSIIASKLRRQRCRSAAAR